MQRHKYIHHSPPSLRLAIYLLPPSRRSAERFGPPWTDYVTCYSNLVGSDILHWSDSGRPAQPFVVDRAVRRRADSDSN